jgi:formylglycine-generating enzyme
MKNRQMYVVVAAIMAMILIAVTTAQAVTIEMVTVADPGNAADTTGYGSVNSIYQVGKYDVTTTQYAEFLNAVAKTDPYGLYTTISERGGIVRSGSSNSYSYSVLTGHENFPVNYVSWGDAARFCNWLHNDQPTDPEGAGTTETGAYTLNGTTSSTDLMQITRNAGAKYFIPSEDEWYKAAYYKAGGTDAGYWLYPTQSNTAPSNALSATGTNNANYGQTDPVNLLTPVGVFASSSGSYGTYDQGGNVYQWNEAIIPTFISSVRGIRGGCFYDRSDELAASYREEGPQFGSPTNKDHRIGFRVASVPEPSSFLLLLLGAGSILYRKRYRKG